MWFNTRKKAGKLLTKVEEISTKHQDNMEQGRSNHKELLSLLPCAGVWESEIEHDPILDNWYAWITYVEDDEEMLTSCRSFDTPEEAKEHEENFGVEFYEWCRYLGNNTYKRKFPPENE